MWSNRIPQLASLALAAATVADGCWLGSRLITPPAAVPISQPAVPFRPRVSAGMQASRIIAGHLFGSAAPVAEAQAEEAQWRLAGVIAMPDPHVGFAMIGKSMATARLVPVGAEVAPGVQLREIYADRVVIDRDHVAVTLRIHWYDVRPTSKSRRPSLLLAAAAPTVVDAAPIPIAAGPAPYRPALPDVGELQQALSLLDTAGGARVSARGLNAQAAAAVGLARGDVITSVNGEGLAGGTTLWAALARGESVTLTVERQGAYVKVTIDPQSLSDAANILRDGAGS